ncbi:hypothetical protein TNCV_4655711 [Trichonephila clavipes]|nr:hypothetical protein TNCV_4655711 [Trichonephila clavipes]
MCGRYVSPVERDMLRTGFSKLSSQGKDSRSPPQNVPETYFFANQDFSLKAHAMVCEKDVRLELSGKKLRELLVSDIRFKFPSRNSPRIKFSSSKDLKKLVQKGVSKIRSSGIIRQSCGYFWEPILNSDFAPQNTPGTHFSCTLVYTALYNDDLEMFVSINKEFGTVIEDDTNVDTEKELSLEQKLELSIAKKISTNQNTIPKSAISKTIPQEIDLFEDERFRGKYLENVYRALLTVPPTSVDAERTFSIADNDCT